MTDALLQPFQFPFMQNAFWMQSVLEFKPQHRNAKPNYLLGSDERARPGAILVNRAGKRFVNERSIASTERFMAIAAEAGMAPVTLATAWSKQHDFVASTIVGVTHEDQLPDILAAADLTLSDEVMKAVDAVTKEILYPMG